MESNRIPEEYSKIKVDTKVEGNRTGGGDRRGDLLNYKN